jgi:hypothetical protein
MKKKKHDKPLHLDMSFDEALKRVAQTDPHELLPPAKPKKAKRKKRTQLRSGLSQNERGPD